MKIFVCLKQVPDTETKIKLTADNTGIDNAGVKWIISPYDTYAIEEGIKLRDANAGSTLTAISVGPARIKEALVTALAMGADEAIFVDGPENLDSLTTAKALANAIRKEGACDLVFAGKLAIDDNASAVPQQLAELLNATHATVVSKLEMQGASMVATREVEGGTKEVIEVKLPAVIAANRGLNNPRFASLPGIMKARKKTIKEFPISQLDINVSQKKSSYYDLQLPPPKPATKMIEGNVDAQVKELVRLLREETKVL